MTQAKPRGRRGQLWSILIAAILAIDLSVRFLLPFELERVLWTEAVLFLAAALATIAISRSGNALSGSARVVHYFIATAFVLGAVRAAMWAAGLPVVIANVSALALALVAVAGAAWRRKSRNAFSSSHGQ